MSCYYKKECNEISCGFNNEYTGKCENKNAPHFMNNATIEQLIRYSEFMYYVIADGIIKEVYANE